MGNELTIYEKAVEIEPPLPPKDKQLITFLLCTTSLPINSLKYTLKVNHTKPYKRYVRLILLFHKYFYF